MRALSRLMLFAFLPMMAGCASTPPIVEVQKVACPPLDVRDEKVFGERVKPPDLKDGLQAKEAQVWIDRQAVLDARKSAAGKRIVAEHKKCRGEDQKLALSAGSVY